VQTMTKHITLALLVVASLIAAPARSEAGMITYTETVDASGSLGGSMFSNALVTLTFVGDTTNITNPSAGIYRNPTGTATVSVAGMMATLTGSVDIFVNQTDDTAGIETFAVLLSVSAQNSELANYDLASGIGPLTGPSGTAPLNTDFDTTAGSLSFSSVASTATFEATVPSSVPEPSSLLLLGLGIAGVAATCLRPAAGRSKSAA
jgi:hypothetical protein